MGEQDGAGVIADRNRRGGAATTPGRVQTSGAGPRVIGGRFGLADPVPVAGPKPRFLDRLDEALLLALARDGITHLVLRLRPGTVWMPSYLCPSMLVGALREGQARVAFYPVGRDLRTGDNEWTRAIAPGDLVCVIDYFGSLAEPEVKAAARARGAIVLEDACQAMLTEGVGEDADYVLFSPRKFVGVPDGGVLVDLRGEGFGDLRPAEAPFEWRLKMLAACLFRRDFDGRGGTDNDRRWFAAFREAESESPDGVFAMSALTRDLLGCIDWDGIRARRRENWLHLHSELSSFAMFATLQPHEVPLGFVARFASRAERDAVRGSLIAEGIYPPVHWDLEGAVPAACRASHELAQTTMTIPCDQRYGPSDMDRVIAAVRAHRAPAAAALGGA